MRPTPLLNCVFACLTLLISTNAHCTKTEPSTRLGEVAAGQASQNATQMTTGSERDALIVLSLIEDSQRLREKLPGFVEESSQALTKHNGALPSAYALRLARALSEASVIRNRLFDQALKHRGALYRIDGELSDADRLAEIVIAMSAAVTLFENNQAMRAAFEDNSLLRKKLNEGYPEFGIASGFYDSSVVRSANMEYRKTMGDAVRYFSDNREAIKYQVGNSSEAIRSLYAHIAQSPMLQKFQEGNVLKEIVGLPVKAVGGVVKLSGYGLGRMKFTTSRVMGNTMGLVRWRAGKLKGDEAMMQAVQTHLQPGDILLEKTPFTLTDKSIPGHFGHAAIYVGTVDQLREMEALELPMVKKHLDKIAAGHVVVEALRSGVHLDTLQDFMNVDDVAILRPKNLSIKERREAVNLALGNLGKKYDFNFDVNTTETIVCSELVYIIYPQVDFVTRRVLGSFAITPDDIAQRAGAGEVDPLGLILFGHDGRLVFDSQHDEKGFALYETLVKGSPVESGGYTQTQYSSFGGFQ